jgi:hypothetical protein
MKDDTAPRSPLLITAIQLGLLLLAIYYTFIGGQTAQGIFDHRWRSITLWLTAVLIGSWLLWRLIGRYKIPRTSFDFPLLFSLGSWLVATVFSVNPIYSQETLVFFVIYLFFFYLAADLGRWPWFAELVFNAVIAVAGLVWTLAVWQLLRWYQNLPLVPVLLQGHEPALTWLRLSVLGNPNTMASYVTLVFPIVLYKLTSTRKLVGRLLLILWVVMLTAAALLTQSRGGLLGLVIASGFYLAVWLWSRRGTPSTGLISKVATAAGTRPGKWLLILGSAVGAIVVIWLLLNLRGGSTDEAVDIRQQVMAGALKTWQAQPVVGAGPGTLGEELIRRQQPLDVIWADAHNLPLTLTAETGLVGLIGLIWLAAVGLKVLWSTFREVDQAQWDMASMACVAALSGFMTHNLVDSLFKFPLIMLLVAIWAGFWISPGLPKERTPGKYWGYPVMAVALLMLLANTVVGLRGIRNIEAYNQAVEAAEKGDWPTALDYLRQADQLAPKLLFYQRQLGLAAGYVAAQQTADPAGQTEVRSLRQGAIGHYEAALSGLDRLPIDHANLACLLWVDDRREAALEEMRSAHELEPANSLYRLNLGYYLEQTGDQPAAWDQYADLLAARPDLLQSSFWQQTELRAAALPGIVQQAARKLIESQKLPESKLIQLYLYAGDFDSAWHVYENYLVQNGAESAESHVEKARILLAEGRLAEAQVQLETALDVEPATAAAHLLLSKIALDQNRLSEAVQHAAAARFLVETPVTLYQAALAAAASGDASSALELYEEAFAQLTTPTDPNLSRYATEVARRRPLPVSYLPCLVWIYPTQLLIDISEAEGSLLEQNGKYLEASRVYQRLLGYEPAAATITTKLDALCQSYPEICDFRAK